MLKFIPGYIFFVRKQKGLALLWLGGTLVGYCLAIGPGLIIHAIYIYLYCLEDFKDFVKKLQSGVSRVQDELARVQDELDSSRFDEATKAASDGKIELAIAKLEKVSSNSELYAEAQLKLSEFKAKSNQDKLELAISLSESCNFKGAIDKAKELPSESNLYSEAQVKISEWEREYQHQLEMQEAEQLIEQGSFVTAITNLEKIPSNSIYYRDAQDKISACQEKHKKFQEERKKRMVESSGRAIEVINLYQVDKLGTNNPILESIPGPLVIVAMLLYNTSKRSGNFLFSQFQLVDSEGCIYDEISSMEYSMWRQEKGFGDRSDDYYPGEVREDVAAFRVSPKASNFVLHWNGKTIKLWI